MSKYMVQSILAGAIVAFVCTLAAVAADAPAPVPEKAPAAAAPAAKPATPATETPAAKPPADKSAAPADEVPWPPEGDARPYEKSPYAQNIDKALKFMAFDKNPERWMSLAVLDYLQRKFGLPERYSIKSTYVPKDQPDVKTDDIAAFGRLVDPSHKYTPPSKKADFNPVDIVGCMVSALYSDRFPPPADFVKRLRSQLNSFRGKGGLGDYGITHYALAFQWMKENSTATKYEGNGGFDKELADALVEIIKRTGGDCDVSYEAMAFLDYMGFRDMVKKEWILKGAAAQCADGGWAYNAPGQPTGGRPTGSQDHPTVLMLWALLEEALPDVPAVPWIQHPQKGAKESAPAAKAKASAETKK